MAEYIEREALLAAYDRLAYDDDFCSYGEKREVE